MIRLKAYTEGLLLSKTEICETVIKQTLRKAEETLEYKVIKPKQTFHFNPPISIEGSWMIRLTSLEVYSSFFNITKENKKFELCKSADEKRGGVSYERIRDEIEKHLGISEITATKLQDDILRPILFEEYSEQVTKRMKDDNYLRILAVYVTSRFQDFEGFLKTEIDLVEDDIRLVLDESNSKFITYEVQPGFCTFKDFSVTALTILQPEYEGYHKVIDIEFHDIAMKNKLL